MGNQSSHTSHSPDHSPLAFILLRQTGPFVAAIIPIVIACAGYIIFGHFEQVFEQSERELPRLTALLLEYRAWIPMLLLPAVIVGLAGLFVQRRYLLYAPYLLLLLVPTVTLLAGLIFFIVSIYAAVIEQAW